MIIGQIYRTARPYGPDPEVIDGYPNYFYETHCEDMPLLNLDRGIFTPARTVAESGVRRSVVILSRAIASAGTEQNPWTEDNFDVENDVIYYSGDNKVAGADPDRAHGNRELITQFHITRSDDITVRQKAAPIVCFERVAVNGQEKGYLKFQGYGFVNDFELVEEQYATGVSFENYRFEIALLPVNRDDFFDWKWINKRRNGRYKDEDTLKYAPSSWQRMVRNGFEVVSVTRSKSTISSKAESVGIDSSQKTISVRAAADYVGESRDETTGKFELLDVFECELDIPIHAMELLLNAQLSQGNISESDALYFKSGWVVSRDWFIPWVLNLTGKASVPEVTEIPEITEIEGETESTDRESISSSDQSSVSSVGSLLDDLESKLDQLMVPDPVDDEVEKPFPIEEGDVEESTHETALPRAVEVFKKHFEIQSSIRSDLELIYGNVERVTSLVEENIDKDEWATESFLGRVLLRSVEEVKQEHEFIRKQLRSIRDEYDATRIVKTLSEGISRVDATLDRLEALVMQSLEVQKEALDCLSDSTAKLQDLNETLPEKALVDQFDTKDLLIELEKFMNSGARKLE